jgi:hypothetical protein
MADKPLYCHEMDEHADCSACGATEQDGICRAVYPYPELKPYIKIKCPLVLVEWEDSRQPNPGWVRLASLDEPVSVRCVSVGWLINNGPDAKMLAPNLGDLDDIDSVQASGVMQIPTRCIKSVVELQEPEWTESRDSAI